MRGSATAVVVGAVDTDEMVRFFATLGFEECAPRLVTAEESARCYGLHGTRTARLMSVPHAADVHVDIVPTEIAAPARTDYELGPRALDLYTTDIEAAVAVTSGAGYRTSTVGSIEVGPVRMRQALVSGPDGCNVVLVESNMRRASVLDRDAARLFSEPHSVVWVVGDRDSEARWWVEHGNATKGMDVAFAEPAVSEYLGLPDSPVDVLMTMCSDAEVTPIRLELLEFAGRATPVSSDGRLHSGLWALVYDSEVSQSSVEVSPGGVRYLIRPLPDGEATAG